MLTWALAAAPSYRLVTTPVGAQRRHPGQAGTFSITPHSIDQISLYDGLTPKFGSVRQPDLHRFFKSAKFGLGGQRPRRIERPRRG